MLRLARKIYGVRFIRFLLVGAVNTLFGFGAYTVLVLLGMSPAWACLIGTILGVLFNFHTTGAIVFRRREYRLLLRFVAVYGVVYFVNLALLKAMLAYGLDPILAGGLCLPVVVPLAYGLQKRWVFNARPPCGPRRRGWGEETH